MRKLLPAAPLPVVSSLSSLSLSLSFPLRFGALSCAIAAAAPLLVFCSTFCLLSSCLWKCFLDVLVTELLSFKVFFRGFGLFFSRFLFLSSVLGWGFVRGNCCVSMEVTKLLIV